MARLYLDEDQSVRLRPLLAQRGHDVIHAHDLGNRAIPDTAQLRIAAAAGRILVTYNYRDFVALHRLWLALNAWGIMAQSHSGILTTWGQIPTEPWAGLLDDFLAGGEVMENRMWEWRRQQQEWEPIGW